MSVHDLDPTCHDADDDFAFERAYDRAAIAHRRAANDEYRATGREIDPMPTFAEFVGGADDDTDDTTEIAV